MQLKDILIEIEVNNSREKIELDLMEIFGIGLENKLEENLMVLKAIKSGVDRAATSGSNDNIVADIIMLPWTIIKGIHELTVDALKTMDNNKLKKQLALEFDTKSNAKFKALLRLVSKKIPRVCPTKTKDEVFYKHIGGDIHTGKILTLSSIPMSDVNKKILNTSLASLKLSDYMTGEQYATLAFDDIENGTQLLATTLNQRFTKAINDVHIAACKNVKNDHTVLTKY